MLSSGYSILCLFRNLGKEHEGRAAASFLLNVGECQQTKPAGESLMFGKSSLEMKTKVCVRQTSRSFTVYVRCFFQWSLNMSTQLLFLQLNHQMHFNLARLSSNFHAPPVKHASLSVSTMLLLPSSKSYNQQLKHRMKLRQEGSNLTGSQLGLMAGDCSIVLQQDSTRIEQQSVTDCIAQRRDFSSECGDFFFFFFFCRSSAPLKPRP